MAPTLAVPAIGASALTGRARVIAYDVEPAVVEAADAPELGQPAEREHERRAQEASAAAAAGGGAGFRAVAPPVMSFAQGRRR